MFEQHQPKLSKLGRSGADGFERVCTFVLLTIRMPLRAAVMDYRLVRQGEDRVRSLFGVKYKGLDYIRAHSEELYERCEYAFETAETDEEAADIILSILCEIPGIGFVKAGFIAQIIYGLSGCIDTHNLKLYEVDEGTFHIRNGNYNRPKARRMRREYNRFCHAIGTANLWNTWCEYLASNDPINYHSATFVSSLHLVPLEC